MRLPTASCSCKVRPPRKSMLPECPDQRQATPSASQEQYDAAAEPGSLQRAPGLQQPWQCPASQAADPSPPSCSPGRSRCNPWMNLTRRQPDFVPLNEQLQTLAHLRASSWSPGLSTLHPLMEPSAASENTRLPHCTMSVMPASCACHSRMATGPMAGWPGTAGASSAALRRPSFRPAHAWVPTAHMAPRPTPMSYRE